MTKMRRFAPSMGLLVGAVLFGAFAACGGDGTDKDAGKGTRITDPAKVPSSTPIQNPVLYQITGDEVTLSGGPSAKITPTGGTPTSSTTHTVVSGDLCSTIAARYGITLDELLKANRNTDCAKLQIGDQLKIPAKAGTTPAPGGGTGGASPTPRASGKTYTVKQGDTCADIAGSYGVKTADLIAKNGLDASCTNLKIGQVLQIP
jgi:LysM repeat protein